jgi:hypothetical protein
VFTTRLSACIFVLFLTAGSLLGDDWPGFRGSNSGAADDKGLPDKWSRDSILWKIKLPGAGTSTPITTGDKIIVTCNAGYGTTITKGLTGGFGGGKGGGAGGDSGDQKKLKLLVICLDRKNGEIVWKKELAPRLPETPFTGYMREHSYASSSPVTDGKNIYAFFGKTGVFAFDMNGEQLWKADVGTGKHMWGSAASPVLHKDLLFVNAAIESKALVALDKNTGKEVWRQKGLGTSWASPVVVETKEGKFEVVISVPGKIAGYDPETGKELWTCKGVVGSDGGGGGGGGGGFGGMGGSYTASTPAVRDGIVYAIGGGGPSTPAASLAVKAGGRGDVSTTHVLWRSKAGASSCSPVLVGNYLCWVDGTMTCLNIADGKLASKTRLYDSRNEYVSAVSNGNKVFALTRTDGMFVVSSGDKIEKVGHVSFDDTSVFNASPAISDGRLYLRSNEYLYCMGEKPAQDAGEKTKSMVKLEDAYRALVKGLSSAKREEREKALRATFPEKKDIDYLFPNQKEKLWPLFEKGNELTLEHLDDVAKELTRGGAILKFEAIDARTDKDLAKRYASVFQIIPKDVPVCEFRHSRENGGGGGGGGGTFLYVHERWLFIKDLDVLPESLDKLK